MISLEVLAGVTKFSVHPVQLALDDVGFLYSRDVVRVSVRLMLARSSIRRVVAGARMECTTVSQSRDLQVRLPKSIAPCRRCMYDDNLLVSY